MKYVFLIILFFANNLFAEIITAKYSGEAFDKNNQLIYKENHEITKNEKGESLKIKTTYFNPAGKKIAELISDFKNDPFIPETEFRDYRFSEQQILHYDVASQIINMKIIDLKTGKTKEKNLKREEAMVSGQGFHNYILKHFDSPQSEIKFIVLPKLDYYSFKFETLPSENPLERKFILKISNWILRALVQKIEVDYRISDKTLLKFDGLTNIESDKRDSQILTIKYPI